jgi:hypothetical protein
MHYSSLPEIVLSGPGDICLTALKPANKPAYRNQRELNQYIEKLIARRAESESYSNEEKALLRRYSGSGGQGKHRATGEGVLYEFYTPEKQIELFFYYHGLRMLKPGGLLVYLSGSNLLRNGYTYNDEKRAMQELGCELLDAYRLPPVFAHSEVPTDILVMRKK